MVSVSSYRLRPISYIHTYIHTNLYSAKNRENAPEALAQDGKGKKVVFPYSLPSVGPGADPGVQAVSPQVT